LPLDGVALPQLRRAASAKQRDACRIAGHTERVHRTRRHLLGRNDQPSFSKNVRRYSAYPRGSLGASQLTYAVPDAPLTTSMMCGTFDRQKVLESPATSSGRGFVENESQPMSFADPSAFVPCVSQTA